MKKPCRKGKEKGKGKGKVKGNSELPSATASKGGLSHRAIRARSVISSLSVAIDQCFMADLTVLAVAAACCLAAAAPSCQPPSNPPQA